MSSTLIATTRRGAFNALRFQGILVTESYAQLAALLEKRLSPRHARFLAEPAHDASGSTTDWYTRTDKRLRPVAELPENEKGGALRAVSDVAAAIAELAETLKAGPDSSSVIRGNILSLALHYPGEEHLYIAGDQPVLTCWGFDPGSPDVQPEDLVRLGRAFPVPRAAAPAPAAPARGGAAAGTPAPAARGIAAFPLWGALLRLLAGLAAALALYFFFALLTGPSGCLPAGDRPGGCVSTPASAPPAANATAGAREADAELLRGLSAEQEKEESLRRELADLRRRLEDRILECRRTPPPPPELDKKEPEKEEAEAPPPTLADLMPVTPEPEPEPEPPAPQPKPEPRPKPEPKPKAPAQKKGEDLKIPEEARQNKDMRFLEGCWNSDSGLMDSSGDPVTVTYCFDDKGNGTRAINRKKKGDRCAGSVRARFDESGKLLIDADGAACPRGSAFVPHRVECLPGSGGDARCNGRELGGFKNRWNAKFRKN
ncbi:MAG: SrfA family protein [Desulfovibrio sp.]|jgi:hypothetical protein|nr:SrfA family protein [Desulfovibrio sp.]